MSDSISLRRSKLHEDFALSKFEVNHDENQELSIIIGNLQEMISDIDDKEIEQYVNEAIEQSDAELEISVGELAANYDNQESLESDVVELLYMSKEI